MLVLPARLKQLSKAVRPFDLWDLTLFFALSPAN